MSIFSKVTNFSSIRGRMLFPCFELKKLAILILGGTYLKTQNSKKNQQGRKGDCGTYKLLGYTIKSTQM